MILGPTMERPVDAIVSWHPERDLLSFPALALHIAAIYRIPVLNLAADSPREVCEFLRDLRAHDQEDEERHVESFFLPL